jgi:RP/EB family microtubule-associated protein
MNGPSAYDGAGRRRQTKCRDPAARAPAGRPAGMARRQGAAAKPPSPERAEPRPPARPKPARTASEPSRPPRREKGAPAAPPRAPPPADAAQARQRIGRLEREVEQMAQERDFYYAKLRKVEDFCQENEREAIVQQVLEILYEADEEHGFLPPDDDQ